MTSRSQRPVSGPNDRLIDAYLADLEHALVELDAGERDDVVASVREHIDAALSEHRGEPTVQDVELVLGQLGSVDQIARDAGDGSDRPDRSSRTPPDGGSRDGWVPVIVAALALALFWFPPVAVPLALGAGIAAMISMRGAPRPARRRYRVAIALSVIPILAGIVVGVLFVAFGVESGSTTMDEQPIESVPTPAD